MESTLEAGTRCISASACVSPSFFNDEHDHMEDNKSSNRRFPNIFSQSSPFLPSHKSHASHKSLDSKSPHSIVDTFTSKSPLLISSPAKKPSGVLASPKKLFSSSRPLPLKVIYSSLAQESKSRILNKENSKALFSKSCSSLPSRVLEKPSTEFGEQVSPSNIFSSKVLDDLIKTDLTTGIQFFFKRLQLNLFSAKEVSIFIKSLAGFEDDYGKNIIKTSTLSMDCAVKDSLKPGSFTKSWLGILQTNIEIGQRYNRAASLYCTLSQNLNDLYKLTYRSLRQIKTVADRCKKQIDLAELSLEKKKVKLESIKDKIQNYNENSSKDNSLFTLRPFFYSKNPEKIHEYLITKQEKYSEEFFKQSAVTNSLKSVFFSNKLPSLIKTLKDLDEDLSSCIYKQMKIFIDESFSLNGFVQFYLNRSKLNCSINSNNSNSGGASTSHITHINTNNTMTQVPVNNNSSLRINSIVISMMNHLQSIHDREDLFTQIVQFYEEKKPGLGSQHPNLEFYPKFNSLIKSFKKFVIPKLCNAPSKIFCENKTLPPPYV